VRPLLFALGFAWLGSFAACAEGADITGDEPPLGDGGTDAADDPETGSSSGRSSPGGSSGGSSSSGDASSGGSSSGGSSSGAPTGPCGTVLINEVQHQGSADFVELFNAGDCDVDLSELALFYRSETGNSDAWNVAGDGTLDPGAYFVFGEDTFDARDADLGGGLGGQGGKLALKRGSSTVDAVGWGADASGSYVEGDPAEASGTGESLQRQPNGGDTDDNASDFGAGDPTPGAANE
jgi:hypothetical protein